MLTREQHPQILNSRSVTTVVKINEVGPAVGPEYIPHVTVAM